MNEIQKHVDSELDRTIAELQVTIAHLQDSKQHLADGEMARYAAHLFAAKGHMLNVQTISDELNKLQASRATPNHPVLNH